MNYKINNTYFSNKKEYYKSLFKYFLNFIIPFYIKTPSFFQMSNDKQIAVEKIGYLFGWHWKKWKWAKLTGRIFKKVENILPISEQSLVKSKSENIIVYATEDFTPYEFEPYMSITLNHKS